MGQVLYRHALDRAGEIGDIADVRAGQARGPFTCPGCGGALIAKARGARRAPHFAHAADRPCGGETYLHGLAKHIFAAAYRRALTKGHPFPIVLRHDVTCERFAAELGAPCAGLAIERRYDLARRYGALRVEARDGAFIPDVLLENVRDPADTLYVEFAVTHELSPTKAASDRRIVEVPILDEGDCHALEQGLLDPAALRLVNISSPTLSLPPGECQCARREAARLEVFADGSWRVREGILARLVSEPPPNDRPATALAYCLVDTPVGTLGRARDIDALFGRVLAQGVRISRHQASDVNAMSMPQPPTIPSTVRRAAMAAPCVARSCFSCQHGRDTFGPLGGEPIACRYHGRQVRHDAADGCDAFAPRGRPST